MKRLTNLKITMKRKKERCRGDSINRYEIVKVLIFKRNNRIKKKTEDLN